MRLTAENGWRATLPSARRGGVVLGRGAAQPAGDVGPQLRRRENLDILAPLEDPQPDLDRPADRRRPQERAVRLALGLLLRVPASLEDPVGDGGREPQANVDRCL